MRVIFISMSRYVKKIKRFTICLSTLIFLNLSQLSFAITLKPKATISVDAIDKTTNAAYELVYIMAGLVLLIAGLVAAWALITGPGEGIMKLIIRVGAAGVLLALSFNAAPAFYNFCL